MSVRLPLTECLPGVLGSLQAVVPAAGASDRSAGGQGGDRGRQRQTGQRREPPRGNVMCLSSLLLLVLPGADMCGYGDVKL